MTTPTAERCAVVTGVGRPGQLGAVVAATLAGRGHAVALVGHALSDAVARADELRAVGATVFPFAADLTGADDAMRLAADVERTCGPVATLVNVAGGFALSGPLDASDPAVWSAQFRRNVDTAYAATRAFLPQLRINRGAVVFLATISALPAARVKGLAAYAASKTAVLALMRAVAQDERATGVRSNAVAPGSMRTPANVATMPSETKFVEPSEVARVIAWLASPDAASVTGQVIEVSA